MIQKCSTRATLMCIIACFLLLVAFFPGSNVQADGGGNQWPDESPAPTSSTDDSVGINGIEAMIAVSNLVQLIL